MSVEAHILSEREVFLAALEKPASERAAFVAAACGADQSRRQRLEALLKEEQSLGSFLEDPAFGRTVVIPGADHAAAGIMEKPGDRIGRYKILQMIGEGGCGVVYMAEQEEPVRRRVALKIIKVGMDTRSVIARFEVERQALAMMDHPNIAKVFDGGATGTGRPYFVMELVCGVKITEYCDENNLPTQERLALFIQVCNAIQHAHQKGIIHRDIKPSNILVTLHDGRPVPKVIDFGIAKAIEQRLTDKTLFTQFAAFIGTPAYMSPEQAEISAVDIDTRSDVYSLGVLLYELLTGKTPFEPQTLIGATLEQCRRTIRDSEPPRPSNRLADLPGVELTTTANRRRVQVPALISSLRGDLDWIVMKCLDKDRTRRYATVHDLTLDVENFLQGQEVTARPPSTGYRLRKLYSRHKASFLATAAVSLTVIAAAGLSLRQAIRATRAEHRALTMQVEESRLRRQAEAEKAAAALNEYVADINLAHQAVRDGNFRRATQLLSKHVPQANEPDLRGFEWRYLQLLCHGNARLELPPEDGPVQSVALSPNGEWVALGLGNRIDIFDAQSKRVVKSLPKGAFSLAFLSEGRGIVSVSPNTIRAWDTTNWTEQVLFTQSPGRPGGAFERPRAPAMALSQNGARLAGVTTNGVRIWDTAGWKMIQELPNTFGPISFSPDAKRLAVNTREGLVVWSLENTGKLLLPDSTNLFGWFQNNQSLTFSPDGRYVLSARNTLGERGVFIINIWDAQTGALTYMPDDPDHIEHTGAISALAFSPDGKTLASTSADHSIRLWDFERRERTSILQGHLNEVRTLAFSRDGERLVSGAKDGAVYIWPVHQEVTQDELRGPWSPIGFTKDSARVVIDSRDTVAFLNVKTREIEQEFTADGGRPGPRFALSASGHLLAQSRPDGHVRLWHTETRRSTDLKLAEGRVDVIALSPDGTILITGGQGWSARWWELGDVPRERVRLEFARVFFGPSVQFSPDGQTLAAFARNGIQLWDVATATVRTNLAFETSPGFSVSFSADGHLIATSEGFGDTEYAIRVWRTDNAELVGVFNGHKQSIASIAFSPDGKTLASSSDDSTLKFWNIKTQQELLNIRRLGGPVRGLLFSPDGQLLIGRGPGGLSFFRAPL